jgi:hypothetical protein
MRTRIVPAAAAVLAALSSAAFAAPTFGGIPHETRRAGDHFTVVTDDQELVCKALGGRARHSAGALGGPSWERSAFYLKQVGQVSCLPRTPAKG